MPIWKTKPGPLGERLRYWREQRQMSLHELSDASGLDRSMIFRIETGDRPNPSAETVIRLARGLRVTLDDLLGPGMREGWRQIEHVRQVVSEFLDSPWAQTIEPAVNFAEAMEAFMAVDNATVHKILNLPGLDARGNLPLPSPKTLQLFVVAFRSFRADHGVPLPSDAERVARDPRK